MGVSIHLISADMFYFPGHHKSEGGYDFFYFVFFFYFHRGEIDCLSVGFRRQSVCRP